MTWGTFAIAGAGVIGLGVYAYEVIENPASAWRERMLLGFFAGVLSFVFLIALVVLAGMFYADARTVSDSPRDFMAYTYNRNCIVNCFHGQPCPHAQGG